MFKLEINTNNEAFAGDPAVEVARILAGIVRQLDEESCHGNRSIFDVNGNAVGRYDLTLGLPVGGCPQPNGYGGKYH